jgi:hypothetical protein
MEEVEDVASSTPDDKLCYPRVEDCDENKAQ